MRQRKKVTTPGKKEVKRMNKKPYTPKKSNAPIKETPHINKTKKYSKAPPKSAVKPKNTKLLPKLNVKNIMNKFRGLSPKTKFGIAAAGAMVAMSFVRSVLDISLGKLSAVGRPLRTRFDDSEGYIPDKYNRGYDAIKERITDFGSRVHLDKATNKSINNYKSSTRKARVTTCNAITNSNLALASHKNAIKHNRF